MRLKLAHGFPMLALALAVQDVSADVTARDDVITVAPGQSVTIDVSANDDWTGNFYQIVDLGQETQAGGTISYEDYGGLVTYQAPEDYEGEDSFFYYADDGTGYGQGATVFITVQRGGSGEGEEGELESTVSGVNNKRAARVLDNICERIQNDDTAGLSEGVINACNEFGDMSDEQRRNALAQINPEEVLAMRQMMSSVSQNHTQRVYQHQGAMRTGRVNRVAINGNNLSLQNYIGGAAGEQNSRWGMFTSIHYDGAEHSQTKYEAKYEMTGIGASVGVDYRLSPRLFMGGAVDWSTFEVEYSSGDGKVDNDVLNVTGFITWYVNQFSFDMQLGYGKADFDSRRNIDYTGVATVATGSTSSDQYNLSLQTDWTHSRNALTLRPYLRMDYMSTEIDGYTESSSSPWAVRVGDQDVDQITTSLGLDTTYSMSFGWGVFVPGLKISAVSESSSDYSPVRFQLVGVSTPDGVFELQPDTEDSLYYQYDLNAVFLLKGGWSTFLSGQFISGYDNFSTYVVSGGVRMEM